MTLHEALKKLEALGTEQNRKIYRRHGAGENLFGVSFAHLGALKKQIKTDHALALALWDTGNDDARQLALMVADPARMTGQTIETWAKGLNGFLSGTFAGLVGRTPLAREQMEAWLDAKPEWTSCVGWLVLAHLAAHDANLPDTFFTPYLRVLEREIHQRRNWVRSAMNGALIAIGSRNPALAKEALAAANVIGRVEVDHGQTGCKTPDAAAYIRQARARKAARAEKA